MNIQQVMIPDHDVATARVPGPARVGSGPGRPGQGQLTSHLQRVCNLLGCRGTSVVWGIPNSHNSPNHFPN